MPEYTDLVRGKELGIQDYLGLFLKRRYVFIAVTIVAFVLGAYSVWKQPFQYESRATVLIGPPTIQVKTLAGNVITQRYEAQNEMELMRSDATVKRIVELLKDQKERPVVSSSGEVKGALKIEPNKDKSGYMTNVIRISATSTDPEKAYYIVKNTIQAYVEASEEYRRSTIKQSYDMIARQLSEKRKELEDSEKALTKFVIDHDIIVRGIEVGTKQIKGKTAWQTKSVV